MELKYCSVRFWLHWKTITSVNANNFIKSCNSKFRSLKVKVSTRRQTLQCQTRPKIEFVSAFTMVCQGRRIDHASIQREADNIPFLNCQIRFWFTRDRFSSPLTYQRGRACELDLGACLQFTLQGTRRSAARLAYSNRNGTVTAE